MGKILLLFKKLFVKINDQPNNNLYRTIDIPKGIEKRNIIYASTIPMTVNIGNLIYNQEYEKAIKLGNELLITCEPLNYDYASMIHINLMEAYFKARETNVKYFEMSTYHAKQAMICGHNTGMAQERLIINLEKERNIHQALQVCNIILSDKFIFSKNGYGSKGNILKRKERLEKNLAKSLDINTDKCFLESEIVLLYSILEDSQEDIIVSENYITNGEVIRISISEYYENKDYFSIMPDLIFNALEIAFLKGKKTAIVQKAAYDDMIKNYNKLLISNMKKRVEIIREK
jgi:hypothetical protein